MPDLSHPLAAFLRKRIVVLDGAMGTTLQRLDLTEADLRPFRVGRDSLAPITELPVLPLEAPRPPEPPKEPPKQDEPVNPLAPPIKKPGGGL